MPAAKRRPTRPVPTLELPEHFKATEAELPVLSRLVRLMRQKDTRGVPWIGPFIEWLLYRETTNTALTYQSSSDVLKALTDMGSRDGLLASTSGFIKAARRECPGITFASTMTVPGVQGRNKEPNIIDALPIDQEDQFYQILRLWRLEYPEPPKRREFPKGRTQHEMDPDSDWEAP